MQRLSYPEKDGPEWTRSGHDARVIRQSLNAKIGGRSRGRSCSRQVVNDNKRSSWRLGGTIGRQFRHEPYPRQRHRARKLDARDVRQRASYRKTSRNGKANPSTDALELVSQYDRRRSEGNLCVSAVAASDQEPDSRAPA